MSFNLGVYASVPDFIDGITREIWQDRGIGAKLQRYYAADIVLRAATGLTASCAGVVAQTLQTLHQFPDRQLVSEDVIWAALDERTFLSSHRLTSVMRHTGDGSLGPASGRQVRSRIIAECCVQDGVVVEEWLVRDQAAFARCLGTTPRDLAARAVERELAAGQAVSFFLPQHDLPSRVPAGVPQGLQDDATLHAVVAGLQRLWGDKETSVIRQLYFHGASLHAPGGTQHFGHGDIDTFVLGYLASFPDAEFTVHSARINRDPERPARIALRWSLSGTHAGHGHFGEPTGAAVHIMGMSHLDVTQGQVMAEYLVTDEVAVWKQIHAHRLAGAPAHAHRLAGAPERLKL